MKLFWMILIAMMPSVGFANQGWLIDIEYPFYIMAPNGGQTPCTVDFEDFIAFAQAFHSTSGSPNWNINADTNSDGIVNFPDFIAFAGSFGKSYTGERCLQVTRSHIRISGQISGGGKPIENVWVKTLALEEQFLPTTIKSDSSGSFTYSALMRGDYAFVPERFGYVFEPDTLLFTMGDSSITVPPIQGHMQFGLVDIKVIRNQAPVVGAEVSFWRAVAGQQASGPWLGVTDTSGVTAVRIPVVEGASDISGTYLTRVLDVATGEVLDSWTSVPLQTEDTRRLILDVGADAYFVPAREYFFYFYQDQRKISFNTSEEQLRIVFRDEVDEITKGALLTQLGLRADGEDVYSLTDTRGRAPILEAIYLLKRSGLVNLVAPKLDAGKGYRYGSDHLMIDFVDGTTEVERAQFVNELGGVIAQPGKDIFEGFYEVEVFDLLSQDVFELSEQYRVHPLVKSIQPHIEFFAVVFGAY